MLDGTDVHPGRFSYAQEIPQAIRDSGAFVLILSEKAQESKWVPRELDQAINCGKVILPYMLEDCPLRNDFSFYLTNVQRYDAFRDPEGTLARMAEDICKMFGIVPPPAPVEEAPAEVLEDDLEATKAIPGQRSFFKDDFGTVEAEEEPVMTVEEEWETTRRRRR